MKQIELSVQTRVDIGSASAKRLRAQGWLPAIVYGEGKEAKAVQVSKKDFDRILRQTAGESGIYRLQVLAGDKKEMELMALLKDIQYDPVSDQVRHLDFLHISMDKEITTKVAIILKGEPIGLKTSGATLDHILRELEITCLPKDIPQHIEVNIETLDIHQSVHISNLQLPEGVRTRVDESIAIASIVYSSREAESTEEGSEEATKEPEVLKEKPKDAAAPSAGAKKA